MALLLAVSCLGSAALAARFELVPTVGLGDELSCLTISHTDPNIVLVGTVEGKIHRTTDGGRTWQEITATPQRSLFFGRERQDDPRQEYALGLPGKSPHLQSFLRSRGLHTAGHNLQEVLVTKGDKPARVNWLEIDWHDPNRVWMGTGYGLYRSQTAGRGFVRVWIGRNGQAERAINTVATDPGDKKVLILGTAGGLFRSTDRGNSFKKEMNFYVAGGYIRGLWYDREFKGLVHMAMGGASMASPDHGKNWITTHWHLWHPRSSIQWISLGPNNVRVAATRDGVWASWQGGEMGTWTRRGMRFVNENVISVLATKDPGIWYAATPDAVWYSSDYGNNWRKVMQLGGKEYPVWMEAYANDPQHLWLLTNRHVYRLGGVPKVERRYDPKGAYRDHFLKMPELYEFWKRVLKYKHVHFADNQRYRSRAPWAAFLPELFAGFNYSRGRDAMLLRSFPYVDFPWTYHNRHGDAATTYYVMANWELSRLIFDRRSLPHFGRIERALEHLRRELTTRVLGLYTEYRAIARRLVYGRAKDPIVDQFERLRLQELAAFFDAISGGYWSKKTGGIR